MKLCYTNANVPFPPTIGEKELQLMVSHINSNIRPFHMEIRKGASDDDGTQYYALINTSASAITRLASDYTVNELEYFKKIVDVIVMESENGSASTIDILNAVDRMERRLTKKVAEELIEKFVKDKWLVSDKGTVSLSPRSLIELDGFLAEKYPEDTVNCALCKKIAMKGEVCSNCSAKIHYHCSERYFRSVSRNCPSCKKPWSAS